MAGKKDWFIKLGKAEWLRFTYEREPNDALQLLGSVTRGARIGALGKTADGSYFQINGDYQCRLNPGQIRRALSKARPEAADGYRATTWNKGLGRPTPVVVVKRRRVVLPNSDSAPRRA